MYKLQPAAPEGETVPPDVVTLNEATPDGTSIFQYCGVLSFPLTDIALPLGNHVVESDTKFALNVRLALPTVNRKLTDLLTSFPVGNSVQLENLYVEYAVAVTVQDCPDEYVPPPEVVPIYDGDAEVVMVTACASEPCINNKPTMASGISFNLFFILSIVINNP